MGHRPRTKKTRRRGATAPPRARAPGNPVVTSVICISLAAIVWIVFGQTLRHEFVNYDDRDYVVTNVQVARGLTLDGIVWAFTHVHSSNWHPLTWISHMLDAQFYGLSPGGHHLTNVLLHAVTAILLFLVLRQMTGASWRSAFVAAVFAIHPLRVESVAWVAERKDVLSGLFFMLTIGAYVRYARAPWSPLRYGLVVLLFAMGLMCKPMLVTMPFVLLLLDYWPLDRFVALQRRGGEHLKISRLLLMEKLPLLGLGLASCAVTLFAQESSLQPTAKISLPLRLSNAVISYTDYLRQMFWPSDLAALYPWEAARLGFLNAVPSIFLLAGISAAVFALRRRRYLVTGWLWYLVMLGPVIGILQVGNQARADRYTYLPQIGLYLMLTWSVFELCVDWRHRRVLLASLSSVILVCLIFAARAQVVYWQNSETLWSHALACTADNVVARGNLGDALLRQQRLDEAIVQFRRALAIDPNYSEANNNIGYALANKSNWAEAISFYRAALRTQPSYANAHDNLGVALAETGKTDEAIMHFREALRINPDFVDAHCNLANVLLQLGRRDEATAHLKEALRLKPNDTEVREQLHALEIAR